MGQEFWKKSLIFLVLDFVSAGYQIERNIFFHQVITSKLWRIWSLALPAHNFLSQLQICKVCETMVSKYGYLMLPGAVPDKVTSDIDFACKVVGHCDVPVVKILM